LVDRWKSSIQNIRSFSGADCDPETYLVVAKFRERKEVILQTDKNIEGEIFNLRKPTELEVKKQYHIKF